MITTGKVEEMCEGKIYHVQSHQNDALSGRAIATVVKTILEEGLVDRCAMMGVYFLERFNEIKDDFDCVVDARGRGLLLALQLGEDYSEKGEAIQWNLIDKGYLMDFHKTSNSFRFFPPFTITQKEIDGFIGAFRESLSIHCA
jgi:4-aminobutyrate aminotransferase-like enzyme